METANAALENQLFNNVSTTRYPTPSGFEPSSGGDTSNHYVSWLNGTAGNNRIGPSIVLKVMAQDTVSASVYGWYQGAVQPPPSPEPPLINDLLSTLSGDVLGVSGGHLAGVTPVSNALNAVLPAFLGGVKDADYISSQPKAFLNWVLFDDQLNYVTGNVVQMPSISAGQSKLVMQATFPVAMPKNGYLYIYLSNESAQDVFFDNLNIQYKPGSLLEETHYYPYGLTMAGISDKALKGNYAENKYRYNGGNELQNKEFSDGSGLESYDALFRMYDPQIGRFWQQDPLADLNENSSPYSFAYNRPINYNDPSGLDTSWKSLPTFVFSYRPPQAPRAEVNVDLVDVVTYTPFQHAFFLYQVDRIVASPPTWWQSFTHDIGYRGKNLLGQDIEDPWIGGIAPSGSFSRFNPKDVLKLYKIIKNLQWSSRSVAQAAKLLLRGAKEVTVKNKEEAEELYLGLYQKEGYINSTGFSGKEVRENEWSFPEGKEGTFHWDTEDTQHGGIPHLQIHDREGSIIRIFYNQ